MGFGLSSILSPVAMETWGFRIPFLFGVLIGPVGLYIRRHLDETAAPEAREQTASAVLTSVFREHLGLVVIGVLTICGGTINTYILGKYMTTYAIHTLQLPTSIGMLASAISGATTMIGSILGGWLSDRFGRRPIMITPRILFVLLVYPGFVLVSTHKDASALYLMIVTLVLPHAMSAAVGIVALPECFPRARRTSGLSITYAVAVTIFGGSAQLVVTWLLDFTGNPMSIAWYLVIANVITMVAFYALRPPNERAQLA
jgi:MFS family permease